MFRGLAGEAYSAFCSGRDRYLAMLVSDEASARAAAAFAAAFALGGEGDLTQERLAEQLRGEQDPHAAASQLLAAGLVRRYLGDGELPQWPGPEDDELVRGAVAGARVLGIPAAVTANDLETLVAAVGTPAVPRVRFPWYDGAISAMAVACLRSYGAVDSATAVDALLRALERHGRGADRVALVHRLTLSILELAFAEPAGRGENVVLASELSSSQRAIVERIAAMDVPFLAASSFGMPVEPSVLRRWLGQESPSGVDRTVELVFGGEPQALPIWKWVSASTAGRLDVANLIEALRSRVTGDELFSICQELTERPYGLPVPSPAFLEAAVDAFDEQTVEQRCSALCETLLRSTSRYSPQLATLAVAPLARRALAAGAHPKDT